MQLSEQSAKTITKAFTSQSLLDESTAVEVVEALEAQKTVNWNIVLTKQFQSEQKGDDETNS
tara:strand:+ start:1628 stop:1813 length:186 start_codon:yes stop_codon:yes gene_type:complete